MQKYEKKEKECASGGIAERYYSEAEDAQSYVEEVRKQVRPAEARLQWVEQELSALLAERAGSMIQVFKSNRLEGQANLPKRTSRSGQTTLKNLLSNRSGKLAPRRNHDKNKNGASTKSALGPIHPSRVSKAAEREVPRRRQQSKILTEHGESQSQRPNTKSSLMLPANVAPRRSHRLFEKMSGALEASSDADLGKGARSPDVILRRSDRISKQK